MRTVGRVVASSLFFLGTTWTGPATSGEPINISIGFSGLDLPRVNMADGELSKERPGWYVELARRVGNICGHTVSFHYMPWARILKRLSQGKLWVATNSSYKVERTEFGQYPMVDGKPDEDRAFSRYAYIAVVREGTNPEIVRDGIVAGKSYITERGNSVVSLLKEKGAVVDEVSGFKKMVTMLRHGRADAIAIIESNFDDILKLQPQFSGLLQKAANPILKRVGYLMVSKPLYQQHTDLVECFWTETARLKETKWFQTLQTSYENP